MKHVLIAIILCLVASASAAAVDEIGSRYPVHAVATTPSGIRIHAVRTGQIQIKAPHQEMHGPAALRFPRIFLSGTWAEWMPIFSCIIEHPERLIVVDTGPSPATNSGTYFDCDPSAPPFYEKNLRFRLEEGDTLGARMQQLGLDVQDVSDVLITHFHSDHVGGLESMGRPSVYTGPGNWPDHVGAFTCRLPDTVVPTVTEYTDGPFGPFAHSRTLTEDGRVRIVPLAGHTPGHAGLLIEDGGSWLIAGDATFSIDQTERGAISGVSQDVGAARQTQAQLRTLLDDEQVVLLPAHDWTVFARLADSTL